MYWESCFTMESFSDERRQRNYETLVNTISFLENGGRITEDWVEENKDRITLYRECFEDFAKVNPEIDDPSFRRLAEETEVIMSYLYVEVIRTRTFTVNLFLQLNKHILALVSNASQETELLDMFKTMGLK
jgi:hypothetical protein